MLLRFMARRIRTANRRASAAWNDPKWQKKEPPKEPPKEEPVVLCAPEPEQPTVNKAYLPHVDAGGVQWRRTTTVPPWTSVQ